MECSKKDFIDQHDVICEKRGFFVLFDQDDRAIYADLTSDLQKTIFALFQESKEEKEKLQLLSLTKNIYFEYHENWIDTYVNLKFLCAKWNVDIAKHEKNYVYLGIDFFNVPFFQVFDDTTKEKFYIGPFQNRFFIFDFLEVMADIFQYPFCETEKYPCKRYRDNSCSGLCLKDRSSFQKLVYQNYLQKNERHVSTLQKRRKELVENLHFSKADKLTLQIKILEKFEKYLTFFHVSKKLNFQFNFKEYDIGIKKGQIDSIKKGNETFRFPIMDIEYNSYEKLALDKSIVNEGWIIFQYFQKQYPETIEKIYKKSVTELMN